MTDEQRKQGLLDTLEQLNKLPEDSKIKEFASMVYAKLAICEIIERIKRCFPNPEDLQKATETDDVLKQVVAAANAYTVIGVELGYATENKEGKDVSE